MIPTTCAADINTTLCLADGVPIAVGQGLTTSTRADVQTKKTNSNEEKKKPQAKTAVKTTKSGKTILPPISINRKGLLSRPKTSSMVAVSLPVPPPAVLTPKKSKQKRAATAGRKNVKDQKKKAKLKMATQAKAALQITEREADASLTLSQKYKTAMDCFERYGHNDPEHLWIINEQEVGEEVLAEALNPQQIEEAYIFVLNDDNHFLVLHTLTQLNIELRLSNPIERKIAGFVGYS
jgi:hypothetical protein